MAPGETVSLRRDLSVTAFRVDHRIPTLGFLASEVRRRLRPEWSGKGEEAVREAAAGGADVAGSISLPLVAYSGDTAAGFFDLAPKEVFEAKVLLLECSFVEPTDEGRSAEWKHLHLAEIAERADQIRNEVLVLTHLTLRTSPEEITQADLEPPPRLPREADRAVRGLRGLPGTLH